MSIAFAQVYSYDFNTGTYLTGANSYGCVTFPDPFITTSVPTPALLPGLIGLGVMRCVGASSLKP
ncbi:PTPA-CTERM sorting domain-containing protein [Nodosilinea sp. E11]|uniref:PTPA-CTERM sorting domain-containing protein n=1 Tax=Nodosilinea sp. E11 TaxID=3037479 RepID=UPI003977480D